MAMRQYIIYPAGTSDVDNYVWGLTGSDPYHGKRVRHDELLHEVLTEIFREQQERYCRSGDGSAKKLLRKHNTEWKDMLKLVLKRKPSLGKMLPQESKLSLLWIAVLSCYQKSAELLVRSGADVNERCESKLDNYVNKKTTILHLLLQMYPSAWNEGFVNLVTDRGADLRAWDSRGQTALHLAVIHARVQLTEMLLEKGADVVVNLPDNDGETPLIASVGGSKVYELLPLLIKHGADVNSKDGFTQMNALHCLANEPNAERIDLARFFIEKGVSLEDRERRHQYQPIHLAALKGKYKMVKLFLDHGAGVNAKYGSTQMNVLHCLADAPDHVEPVDLARVLIEKGASLDDRERRNKYQPIHLAALNGKNEMVKLFLDHGADVNARARRNVSPLYLAAGCHNPDVLLTLLKRGANIDLKTLREHHDRDMFKTPGQTALHKVCKSFEGSAENIKILLSVGADACCKDADGETPMSLMTAWFDGHPDPSRGNCTEKTWLMLKMLAQKKASQPSIESKDEPRIRKPTKQWMNYYQDCVKQIGIAKSTRLIESCTVFDLLTKCQCQAAQLMRNPEFGRKFRLCNLDAISIYAQDVREAFERAERHYAAVVDREEVINEALYNTLPYIIVRKVAAYAVNCEICELKKIVHDSRQ